MTFHTPNSQILTELLPAIGTRVELLADDAGNTSSAASNGSTGGDTVIVVGLTKSDAQDLELVAFDAIGEAAPKVLAGLEAVSASAKLESITRIPAPEGVAAQSIVAVGLGSGEVDSEEVRRAAGAAGRALQGTENVVLGLGVLDPVAAAEGFALGAYSFRGIRAKREDAAGEPVGEAAKDEAHTRVTVVGANDAQIQRAATVADAVATARDLVNTNSGHLYPESFANIAEALGKDAGLDVEVLDEKALAEGNYGGLLAVGTGSQRGPRLVRLGWKGADNTTDANDNGAASHLALVGKGITFDTGGISLKPGANMENMISDMGGAGAVLATVVLAARLNATTPVTAWLPMAENMPDGKSYRPGDVITQYGGITCEILNTDAEGRLVLADALVRASEESPTHIIDTATLTGAQLVALGGRTPGVMGTDDFRDFVAEASQNVGENGWAMPIPDQLAEGLKSEVADLRNISPNREGGMSVAAAYLREFIGDDIEWAHIDVAGPAFNTHGAYGYTPKRATGVPVRTMFEVIEQLGNK